MVLGKKEGHTRWTDAEAVELAQLHDYKTFLDLGHGAKTPTGYQCIRCRFVYDMKHDGCYKARFVAGDTLQNLTRNRHTQEWYPFNCP